MRAKKLRTEVVGLVAAVMVVGAPLTAWAIDGGWRFVLQWRANRHHCIEMGVKQVLVATTW